MIDEADIALSASSECLQITPQFALPLAQIQLDAVRSQGAGGQNVNKTATAIHLRFDVRASSLPEPWKQRVLARRDQRLSREGVIVIKAQQHRSQEQNRVAALARLCEVLAACAAPARIRKPTRVPKASRRMRVDEKTQRGQVKRLRKPGEDSD